MKFLNSLMMLIPILGIGKLASAQCTTGTLYPNAFYVAPATQSPVVIISDAYTGEYSIISEVAASTSYRFTSSVATDYFTVVDNSTLAVMGSGVSPLIVTTTSTNNLRVYRHSNSLCATQSLDRTISIGCSSCPATLPVNDNACGAITIPVTLGAPTNRISGYMGGATLSSGTPAGGATCATDVSPDIWFKFVAPASGNVTLQMFYPSNPAISYVDPSLSVYTGGDPCSGNLTTYVNCNDDENTSGNIYTPLIALTALTGGSTYYVKVTKYLGSTDKMIIAAFEPSLLPITSLTACQNTVVNISATSNNLWGAVPVVDASGNRICNIFPQGNTMGNVNISTNVNTGPVRQDGNGKYYLNRSFTITPTTQPTTPVDLNFFITTSDFTTLQAVDPTLTAITSLNTTKNQKSCGLQPSTGPVITNFGGAAYSTLGYILGLTTTSFSTFYLHTGTIPLPVNIISFDAKATRDEQVKTVWNVEGESDVKQYIIQKSVDNKTWSDIGIVKAVESNVYDFLDAKPGNGRFYYRIAVVDNNESISYSQVRIVNLGTSVGNLSLFPNPATDLIFIDGSADKKVSVTFFDALGKTVYVTTTDGNSLKNQGIDISKLNPGSYSVQIKGENDFTTMRFVKQ